MSQTGSDMQRRHATDSLELQVGPGCDEYAQGFVSVLSRRKVGRRLAFAVARAPVQLRVN